MSSSGSGGDVAEQIRQQQQMLLALDTEIREALSEIQTVNASGAVPPEQLVSLVLKLSTAMLILINRTRLPLA